MLLAQIKSSSLPDQQAALTHLLTNVKCRIRSLRKGEKTRKRRWLMKKAKNEFKVSPYKAGKNLLDPKCYCSLKVDQEIIDRHKSSSLFDINYDTPLGNLEGLPPEPPLLKKFNKSSFSYDDLLQLWLHVEMPQHLAKWDTLQGLQKMSENKPISFQKFSCLFQKVRNPYTMAKCSRNIYSEG